MTSSFNSARAIVSGRRAVPWLVGVAGWMLRDKAVELAVPNPCPGLLEFASIAALRLDPDLQIGQLFGVLHAAAVVFAVAAFVMLIDRTGRNLAVAAATGLAISLSPLFASTLGPASDAAAFAICSAAALLGTSATPLRRGNSYRLFFATVALCFTAAFLVPSWLAVATIAAFAAGMTTWPRSDQRRLAGALAAAVVALVTFGVLSLSRPDALRGSSSWGALTACALPMPTAGRAIAVAATALWWLGPAALGLAVLGALTTARRAALRGALGAFVALAMTMLAASADMHVQVAIAPLAVVLWWLAASGFGDLVTMIGRGTMRGVAAALILVLLPTLEASRRFNEERDDYVRPRGHDAQTLRRTTAMLNFVSADASFVEEDATVDVLLRASIFGGRRRGKPFTVVAPDRAAVATALTGRTVYVFPQR